MRLRLLSFAASKAARFRGSAFGHSKFPEIPIPISAAALAASCEVKLKLDSQHPDIRKARTLFEVFVVLNTKPLGVGKLKFAL